MRYSIIKVLVLILACTCMSACAKAPDVDFESNETDDTSAMPDDFKISFSFGAGEMRNMYNTYNGTILKDLGGGEAATASFTPSEETLRAIYERTVEYDIYSITREMTSGGMRPNTAFEIIITADGHTYTVSGDVTARSDNEMDEEADNFMRFVEFMIQIFDDEAERQDLPEDGALYA